MIYALFVCVALAHDSPTNPGSGCFPASGPLDPAACEAAAAAAPRPRGTGDRQQLVCLRTAAPEWRAAR